jgi:hypothetical protein
MKQITGKRILVISVINENFRNVLGGSPLFGSGYNLSAVSTYIVISVAI